MRELLLAAYTNWSITEIEGGRYQEAIDLIDKALGLFPGDERLGGNRAYAVEMLRRSR